MGFHGSRIKFVWRKNDLCPISWICSPPNCALWSQFSAYVQRLNFCAYICKRRMPGINQVCTHDPLKPKFAGNLWNTLDVSTEFPASASVDSLFTVSRSMKLGPSLYTLMWVFILFLAVPIQSEQLLFSSRFLLFLLLLLAVPIQSEQLLFSSRFLLFLLAVPTVRRNRYCFRLDFYCFYYYYSLFLPKSHSVCTRFCGSLIS